MKKILPFVLGLAVCLPSAHANEPSPELIRSSWRAGACIVVGSAAVWAGPKLPFRQLRNVTSAGGLVLLVGCLGTYALHSTAFANVSEHSALEAETLALFEQKYGALGHDLYWDILSGMPAEEAASLYIADPAQREEFVLLHSAQF